MIESDAADVEAIYVRQKGTRKTCYEKSCLRKPIVEGTLKLGKITITKMFCEQCLKELEVFGWKKT